MGIKVDGQVVNVGDSVCFKSDVEQCGKIKEIKGKFLVLESQFGFSGDYIGGDTITTVAASDCWVD